MRNFLSNLKIRNIIEINIGVVIISFAYYFFLLPNNLVIGGVMGISIIIEDYISPALFLYSCYAVLLIIGGLLLGKKFFLRSIYAAALQPSIIFLFEIFINDPHLIMRNIENNQLFVAVICSAVPYGIGGGLMFKNNATTGGMDVVQKIISKYCRLPMSAAIYITDGIVIFLGILAFGLEKGVFAILIMFLCGKFVDFVITGGKNKKALYIVTTKPEEIRNHIYKLINRGVTEIEVTGGFSRQNKTMLFSVLGNREYIKIKDTIYDKDPDAFMFVFSANEVLGAGFSIDKTKIKG